MTIAVEDIDRARPQATAAFQWNPTARNTPETRMVVTPSWMAPVPIMRLRIRQKLEGSSSNPIRNSIITTPNSAKCKMNGGLYTILYMKSMLEWRRWSQKSVIREMYR